MASMKDFEITWSALTVATDHTLSNIRKRQLHFLQVQELT